MREYANGTAAVLKKVICNQCKKELEVTDQMALSEWLSVDKSWGYFSRKDGETHSFDLCEDCYDKLIKGFVLPVDIKNQEELL